MYFNIRKSKHEVSLFIGPCIILIVEQRQTNMMSLALLFHYLLLNMFRMLVHPSSGVCDLLWIYFMCCISLVRRVLVLRCGSAGWCGTLCRLKHQCFSLHKDTAPVSELSHVGWRQLHTKYDQYRRLQLQFCVLLMMGVVDTRNMQGELAE